MSSQEWPVFVSSGTRTGKLAVTRRDGRPHVSPVWFLLDDPLQPRHVLFTTWWDSVKARALGRDPRFALCVDDEAPPYGYVQLSGTARLSTDRVELLHWATLLGERYMGSARAETYGRRNSAEGEFLVWGRIEKVVAVTGIAD